MPRIYAPGALRSGAVIALPAAAARHVQVLRMQPGETLTLFNGEGGEFDAVVEQMGRSDVTVRVGEHSAVEREAAAQVHLAIGVPANERMDWVVEKATELGVASIHPLMAQRSVLRLAGERAAKKQAHWQSIAIAACEQCGRNRVPVVHEVRPLADWLQQARQGASLLLSPRGEAMLRPQGGPLWLLSGPEGGLSAQEEEAAIASGFTPASLGPRILRADTAPLAALSLLTLSA